jgi:trigger factor
MDPNTFIQTVDQQGQIPAMVAEVARSKALAVALRSVAVVDGSGAPVDLSEYIGSDEDDAAQDALEAATAAAAEGDDVETAEAETTEADAKA